MPAILNYSKWMKNIINYICDNKLSEREIYELLAHCGVLESDWQKDRTQLKDACTEYVINKINNSDFKLDSKVVEQGHFFRHVNVRFNEEIDSGVRNIIKLYIPIKSECLKQGTASIYDFLFENHINFESKVSGTERAEMFVLRVYAKEDANKVINFCSNTPMIYENYGSTNPFGAHVNGIGIAKDTFGKSYNGYVSKLLYEYSRDKKGENIGTNVDQFIDYVINKYNSASCSKDKFLTSVVIDNLISISNNTNVLNSYEETQNCEFDPKLFYSYSRYKDESGYYYMGKQGNIINEQTNPTLYISLQAQNCLHKMYKEYYESSPRYGFLLPSEEVNKISSYLDEMLDFDTLDSTEQKLIVTNYNSDAVCNLMPYLYADYAMTNKYASEYESLQIAKKITCEPKKQHYK